MGRSVVLSGYPFFPSQALAMPVDWRVPGSEVDDLMAWTRAWYRVPCGPRRPTVPLLTEGPYKWVHLWVKVHFFWEAEHIPSAEWETWMMVLPTKLAALGVVALLGCAWYTGRWRPSRLGWLLLPVLVALAVWFLNAPAARFAWHLFWIMVATLVAGLFHAFGSGQRAMLTALLLGCVALGLTETRFSNLRRSTGPDAGFHPHPMTALVGKKLPSGLVLYYPRKGYGGWAQELLLRSIPGAPPGLRLRRPHDLSGGFACDPER